MGEDIHFRAFVKSKKTGNYINAHDICPWNPEYSTFNELVGGRNYDVFSLFGSRRSDYRQLDYANYGIPDFLKGSVFDDYCLESGYYGFIWFKLPDLTKAVHEYFEMLRDPLRYLDQEYDSEEFEYWTDIKNGISASAEGYQKFLHAYCKWLKTHANVLNWLELTKSKLAEYPVLDTDGSVYQKLIEPDETILMFFFDS